MTVSILGYQMDFQKQRELGNEYIATEADALQEKSAASIAEFFFCSWCAN